MLFGGLKRSAIRPIPLEEYADASQDLAPALSAQYGWISLAFPCAYKGESCGWDNEVCAYAVDPAPGQPIEYSSRISITRVSNLRAPVHESFDTRRLGLNRPQCQASCARIRPVVTSSSLATGHAWQNPLRRPIRVGQFSGKSGQTSSVDSVGLLATSIKQLKIPLRTYTSPDSITNATHPVGTPFG